jgi:hypothetical protein
MSIQNSTIKIANGKVVFSQEIIDYFENLRTEENSEWINKYFEILSDKNNMFAEKYRNHHIIPCFMFKDETHKTREETLPLANNIEKNLIKLSVRNHIVAHYYLWKIFNNEDSRKAVYLMCTKKNLNCLSENELKEFAKMQEECADKNQTKEEKKEYKKSYIKSEKGIKTRFDWEHSEKGKESNKKSRNKYRKTEKGKESIKKGQLKYNKSEKGKNKKLEWTNSEKGKESHKKSTKKYDNSEKGKNKKLEWANSEKGKECIKRNNKKYRSSEKGKASLKAFNSRKCFDPMNDYKECTYRALLTRKYRNKELYKDVIPSQCLIKES